jgi:triosephosphate isomerase
MRKPFVAGNWKMYTTSAAARELAGAIVHGLESDDSVRVAIIPPFPYLTIVAEVVRGTVVELGAQNFYPEREGAFTGRLAIVGHSERRHKLGEDDAFLKRKVRAALEAGLQVVFCVGETIDERKAGKTEVVLDRQVEGGLQGLTAEEFQRVTIAYEPVWAIGTGHNATPEQAQEAHIYLRNRIREMVGAKAASTLSILYGGSVKPDNARSLLEQPDVDGALVGGASLQAESFLAIVRAARG